MARPKKKTGGASAADNTELTGQEVRFCRHFADHGKITQAVKDAGYTFGSENTYTQHGRKLLRNAQILAQIQDFREAVREAARVTVETVARGLARDAEADRTAILGPDGEVLPPSQWPAAVKAVITGIEVEELVEWQRDPETGKRKKVAVGQKWKIRTSPRTEARKLLGQWLGMFKADGGDGGAEKLVKIITGVDTGKM